MDVDQAQTIVEEINRETPEEITAVADGGALVVESEYSEPRRFRTNDLSEALFLMSFMFASKEAGVEDAVTSL